MVYPPLEELLDSALSAGFSLREFRLGTVQMEEFKEWAERTGYLSSRASVGEGAPTNLSLRKQRIDARLLRVSAAPCRAKARA
jgi:hypothetical protein